MLSLWKDLGDSMKLRSLFTKALAVVGAIVVLGTSVNLQVLAEDDLPYTSYNYNYWLDIVYTPAAYEPDHMIKGENLIYEGENIGRFSSPQDICVAYTGEIYLADTGNNRIIILDSAMKKVINIITAFDNDGVEDFFNQPTGVAISESNQIYVADSQNNRIVVLNQDKTVDRIISNPQSESFEAGYVFVPLKVTVDYANRVYCIAQNMYEGIMVFETNGQFAGFFGTINVDISLWEKFWRKLATKEERAKSQLFIPTEFTGIDIDPDGFVYASNIDADGVQGVRRLNPRGEDVIKKGPKNKLGGDFQIAGSTDYAGPSQFTDVVFRKNGIYSCLDKKRGRIFTYDHEGNLLYIFGGLGTQEGTFTIPTSIESVGNDILVLDASNASVSYFKETEYGKLINQAVSLRFDGDEEKAVALWQKVLLLDENNELANTGIGKAYLTAGDYEKAMKYLKIGMARDYYSVAYKRFRNDYLTSHANVYMTVLIILVIAYIVYDQLKKRGIIKTKVKEEKREEEADD